MTRFGCAITLLLAFSGPGALGAPAPQAPKAPHLDRKPPKGGAGVRQLFDDAMKLYEAGKFPDALRAFDSIVRKYPGHEPAQVQLAKTLYRLEKLKEAYVIFARINLDNLDPETSYEYGWTFYQNKQWQGALYAFQRLPKGHALFDLANYYGGICAIKLRRYEEASDMLEKAVVLPDKLAKSRTLYIKHLQALALMTQKSSLAKERDAEQQRLAASKAGKKDKIKDKPTPPPGPYEHKGSMGVSREAKVSYTIQHQYLENHGYQTSDFDARITAFNLATGKVFGLPFKQGKDRYTGLGMQLNLGASDTIKSGKEARFIIDEENADLSRVQSQEIDEKETQIGSVGGSLWIEFPLPENTWLAIGSNIGFEYPEFDRGNRYGDRAAYLQVATQSAPVNFTTVVAYAELLNEKTQPSTNIISAKANVASTTLGSFSLASTLEHKLYDYLQTDAKIDGPDTETHLDTVARQDFVLGISAALAIDVMQQQNYIHHGIPTFGTTSSDGQTLSGRVMLRAAPLPWLEFMLSQSVAKTRWQLDREEAREPFELSVPDYIEMFNAKLAINLAF